MLLQKSFTACVDICRSVKYRSIGLKSGTLCAVVYKCEQNKLLVCMYVGLYTNWLKIHYVKFNYATIQPKSVTLHSILY